MNLQMLREAQSRVSERKKSDNHDIELLNEFMGWLQENEHINKSEEYRKELCELFIETKRSSK